MKKKSKKPKVKRKAQAVQTPDVAEARPDRRGVLRLALGAVALGGVGTWVVSSVRAVAAEQDLSRLGKGRPTVVQIHDPQCSQCTELQRNTRRALRCFDEKDLLYLVASIKTAEGSAFAARLGLPHVTLVLLDGAGDVENVLQGVRPREELKPHFERLARA